MKKETMKKLMALPQAAQDKVWQLAAERLKQEKKGVAEQAGEAAKPASARTSRPVSPEDESRP